MSINFSISDWQTIYGFTLSGIWGERELSLLDQVVTHYRQAGMPDPFPYPVTITLENAGRNCLVEGKTICLTADGLTAWTLCHELAHSWDAANDWKISKAMQKATGSMFLCRAIHFLHPGWKFFWYHVGSPPPPCGVDKNFNAIEDFAESVTAYLYPEEATKRATKRGMPYKKWGYAHFHETPRGKFVKKLIRKQVD